VCDENPPARINDLPNFESMNTSESLNTDWRKVATTIYKKPVDSKVFGQMELDVSDLEEFIASKRKEGLKITLTHVFTLIYARCLAEKVPELNSYYRRGRILSRSGIDAMVSVLKADGSMGSVKVEQADKLSLSELAACLNQEIQKSKKGDENKLMQKKNLLASLPWPFRHWFFYLYRLFVIKWGFSIPFLGLSPNSFGSFVITNIGSIGLDSGYPALFPTSNVPSVFVLGGVKKKAVVINDEIAIRKMLTVSLVMDHRIVDASHAGKVAQYLKHMVRNPECLL
jgi:pyruvate/2-oxoglutarate dehydrogenase complex dihydrolipoamide acyltransferase (E2) component